LIAHLNVPQSLTFVAVFTNGKLVPNRLEIWSMPHKVQVVELADKYFYNSSLE